ncbi:hypothetical protein ACWGNE_02310 [Streptomyces xiamenensis]
MSDYQHQSTRDYVAARQSGDTGTASRIVQEVIGRFETRTTDGSELAEVLDANGGTR